MTDNDSNELSNFLESISATVNGRITIHANYLGVRDILIVVKENDKRLMTFEGCVANMLRRLVTNDKTTLILPECPKQSIELIHLLDPDRYPSLAYLNDWPYTVETFRAKFDIETLMSLEYIKDAVTPVDDGGPFSGEALSAKVRYLIRYADWLERPQFPFGLQFKYPLALQQLLSDRWVQALNQLASA